MENRLIILSDDEETQEEEEGNNHKYQRASLRARKRLRYTEDEKDGDDDDDDEDEGDEDEEDEDEEKDDQSQQSPQNSQALTVTCGNKTGSFYVDKYNRGEKSIKCKDQWFNPKEFEFFGGRGSSKKWKASIYFRDKPLQFWIEQGAIMLEGCGKKVNGASKLKKRLSSNCTSDSSSEGFELLTVEDTKEDDVKDEDWLPHSDKMVPREKGSPGAENKRGDTGEERSEEKEEKMESGKVEGTETELSSAEIIQKVVLRKATVVLKRLPEKDCQTNGTNHTVADSRCDAVGEDTQGEEEGQFTTSRADEDPSWASVSAGDVNGEESEEELTRGGEKEDHGKRDVKVGPPHSLTSNITIVKCEVLDGAGDTSLTCNSAITPVPHTPFVDPDCENELKLEIPCGEIRKESTEGKGGVPPVEPQSTLVVCKHVNKDTPPSAQTIKLVSVFKASQEPQVSDMVAVSVPDLPTSCNLDRMDLDELKREKLKMQVRVLKLQEEYYTLKIKKQKKNQD